VSPHNPGVGAAVVTERASRRAGHSPALQPAGHPIVIPRVQTSKQLTVVRCLRSLGLLGDVSFRQASEESFVRRLGRVASIPRPTPGEHMSCSEVRVTAPSLRHS
jgi:hypothetical protein